MEPLYTTHDVGILVHVDASTVSKWVDKSMLPAFRTPGGHRRVRKSDLRAFLMAHAMPVPRELRGDEFRLLIVDDERPVVESLKRAIRAVVPHVQVLGTTSGIEAVLTLAEDKPDAALIDLAMPDLDGLEVCRAVRSRPALSHIKLVTMTARHTSDAIAKSQKAGASECLGKPVDIAGLLQLLGLRAELKQSA